MVERAPNERVPLATRVKGSIYNKMIEAAIANDRPLGTEVEMRLEASFRDEGIEARLDEILALIKPVRRVA